MADELVWTDLCDWKVEGQGWSDTEGNYGRIPAKARGVIPDALCDLGRSSTGMHVYFETNAPEIHARWELGDAQLNEPNFASCGFSGLDLYADDGGKWRWVGAGHWVDHQMMQARLVGDLRAQKRKYILYFPLRNRLDRVELGVPKGCNLKQLCCKATPLVYYGTSIVHGAYASHPGLVHASILGRWLKRPVINLGFSGAARMEPEVAHLLAELKPAAYVIDPLANMETSLVNERAEAFLRVLRRARPKTPLVLVENAPLTHAWLNPWLMGQHEEKWAAFYSIYRKLRKEGMAGIFYVRGKSIWGDDSEASSDGLHPNDIGYMRQAQKIFPVLRRALGER